MAGSLSRRQFVERSLASAAALGVAASASPPRAADDTGAVKTPATGQGSAGAMPKGKICDLEISRLLLGGNLLTHFTHSRDLRYVYNLAKHYNTREKVLETMATAEAAGINTLVIHTAPNVLGMLREYREKRKGKIQWIICPTAPLDDVAKYTREIQEVADAGAEAIYVWGVRADAAVKEGKVALVARAVELAKSLGVAAGVGAHELDVVAACEKHKVPTDFYIKTLHHHKYPSAKLNYDSMWCKNPEETVALMKDVAKPWIAFKVMAAGAIPPRDAFHYAFQSGADFALAGMFDFEIAEDVRIARETLAALKDRPRPWRG